MLPWKHADICPRRARPTGTCCPGSGATCGTSDAWSWRSSGNPNPMSLPPSATLTLQMTNTPESPYRGHCRPLPPHHQDVVEETIPDCSVVCRIRALGPRAGIWGNDWDSTHVCWLWLLQALEALFWRQRRPRHSPPQRARQDQASGHQHVVGPASSVQEVGGARQSAWGENRADARQRTSQKRSEAPTPKYAPSPLWMAAQRPPRRFAATN